MNKETIGIKDELKAGRPVIVFTSGVSMEPLLHDKMKKNATHVLIEPSNGVCEVGDMPLVLLKDGRYIIHRIVRVDKKEDTFYYQTRGDNCIGSEYVSQREVLGVVKEIYRKNGSTIKMTDKSYQCYMKLWMRIYPIRRICMRGRAFLGRLYRKLK